MTIWTQNEELDIRWTDWGEMMSNRVGVVAIPLLFWVGGWAD